jgi:hypothetical protein
MKFYVFINERRNQMTLTEAIRVARQVLAGGTVGPMKKELAYQVLAKFHTTLLDIERLVRGAE